MKQLFTILGLLFTVNGFSQTPAFPCAYGAGSYATGGRGYLVYHVTNLNPNGLGSFSQALIDAKANGGGNIVFDVSGVIQYPYANVWEDLVNISILGQTAPQGGITFTNIVNCSSCRMQLLYANNVIIRYIKFRANYNEGAYDGMDVISSSNVIFDHCSISWGSDEAISTRVFNNIPIHDITFQRILIAESKTGNLMGYGSNPSLGYNQSTHKNLFVNVDHRFPNATSDGRMDIINNVVYDWYSRLSVFDGDASINHIGNSYYLGHKTFLNMLNNGSGHELMCIVHDNTGANMQVHSSGTFIENHFPAPSLGEKDLFYLRGPADTYGNTVQADSNIQTATAFPLLGNNLPILSSQANFTDVLNSVGADAYLDNSGNPVQESDSLDVFYKNLVTANPQVVEYNRAPSANYNGYPVSQGDYIFEYRDRYINFHNSVSSTPYNTRPGNFYVSNPHIPEVWFQANVPNGEDHNDTTVNGYTWLEEYVNQVDFSCGQIISNTCSGKNAPVATIVSPLTGNYTKSDTINFGVNYTSDTTVISVSYYVNGSILASTTTPFLFDTIGLAQGTYTSYATLTDACGNSSNSDTVTFTILPLEVTACNTSASPVIDGLEDVMWTTIPSNKFGVTENGILIPDSNNISGTFKVAWDATSLYFFVKVKDDVLFSDSPQLEFFRDDAVSVYLDALDDNSLTYDVNDYAIGFRQGSNDIVENNVLYSGSLITKTDVITTAGYDMEIKIDWAYLSLTPTVGNDIGLDFRVDDDDNGGSRENHVLWNDETSTLWNDPSKFGVLNLVNTNCNNTTSIKNITEDNLLIYPNPTTGELTITSGNLITKIEVYNTLGALVFSKESINTKSQELNLVSLPKGAYSVKVYEANRVVEKQLIKQ